MKGKLLFQLMVICLLLAIPALGQQVLEGEENLLHIFLMDYPSTLRDQRIEGTVTLEATLDDKGHVVDARVLSGPMQLRRLALMSVLG